MKALHICQRDDPATGGASRVAVELVKRLEDSDVEAKCVFVYGEPGPFGPSIEGKVAYLGLKSGREGFVGMGRLRQLIRRESPALVHHHDGLTWTHLATRLIANLTRIGHGHLSPPTIESSRRNRIAHRIHQSTYHHLICVSEATRNDWVDRGFSRSASSVVGNGVDRDRFHPPLESDRKALRKTWDIDERQTAIGFVGRLDSAMKGCREFLDVLSRLPENFIGILAGDGPDRSDLEAQAETLGLHDRIRFLGTVDPATEAYWGFDLFVLTSSYEPFGLVLLEAAASGLPLIVLPASGGATTLASRLGAHIPPDRSIEGFAETVKQVASEVRATGHTATERPLPREFSWEHSTEQVATIYRRVLNLPDTR